MANETIDRLQPEFRTRLLKMVADSGGRLKINNGWRSEETQAALYKAKPKLAAKPGHSNHPKGLAADLEGDLAWAHAHADEYGLRFPMLNPKGKKFEPWHVEPKNLQGVTQDYYTGGGTTGTTGTTRSPAEQRLAGLAALLGDDLFSGADEAGAAAPAADAGVLSSQGLGGKVGKSAGRAVGKAANAARIAAAAKAAGFTGAGLRMAVAVALAEGSAPGARFTNKDKYKSVDRGFWAWNSHWHPEVTDEEADDPMAAAEHAFRVSRGGTNWSQWSTYKGGQYKSRLAEADALIGGA